MSMEARCQCTCIVKDWRMPKQVDQGERRERIAAALMRVAAARGLEAVSLRHVAAEAGVTAGMVQHYFPSKDAMMDFAMRSAAARYEARMSQALARLGEDPPPRAVVGVLLRALLPLDEQQRADGRVGLAFQSYTATRRAASHGLAEPSTGLHDFVAEQVRRTYEGNGGAAATDPVAAATVLVAATEGLALLMLASGLSERAALAALECQLDLVMGPPT